MLPPLSLVLGGAASGKSNFAETLVTDSGRPRVYLATAQAFDTEMKGKIARHQQMRGQGWRTIEEPLEVGRTLAGISGDHAILMDCATIWLSNHLLAEHDLAEAEAGLMAGLALCAAPVVVVTNEVGHSVVPDNALARRFQTEQGRLNQKLAAKADLVVNVVAGLPHVLKGSLPAPTA
ncbi:MAG: bifunctional adenosylcobinamide kinase/adenosylcobinamide-phosphate guanylyltransferase [Pseudomonadota bacterium]